VLQIDFRIATEQPFAVVTKPSPMTQHSFFTNSKPWESTQGRNACAITVLETHYAFSHHKKYFASFTFNVINEKKGLPFEKR